MYCHPLGNQRVPGLAPSWPLELLDCKALDYLIVYNDGLISVSVTISVTPDLSLEYEACEL